PGASPEAEVAGVDPGGGAAVVEDALRKNLVAGAGDVQCGAGSDVGRAAAVELAARPRQVVLHREQAAASDHASAQGHKGGVDSGIDADRGARDPEPPVACDARAGVELEVARLQSHHGPSPEVDETAVGVVDVAAQDELSALHVERAAVVQ